MLQLKRFDFLNHRKLSNKVKFFIRDFDIYNFCKIDTKELEGKVSHEDRENDKSNLDLYDLQGIVCHVGTLDRGHYIAYVLSISETSGEESSVDSSESFKRKQWLRCEGSEPRCGVYHSHYVV